MEYIGGQALIEGIVMRSREKTAIVVRKKDGNFEIKEKINKKPSVFSKIPFIRGIINLFSSLIEGYEALDFSAKFIDDDNKSSKFEVFLEKKLGSKKFEKLIMAIALIGGTILPLFLFIFMPTFIVSFINIENNIALNLIEGLVRISIFLIFMYLISKMPDIKRTFGFHGAEHKTIACYEAGLELTVENVRPQTRMHKRCGTSFLFIVMIISILLFSVVPSSTLLIKLFYRIFLIPVVIGISYEFIRYEGSHDNLFTKILAYPGLMLQKLTTNEPDDFMIETAIEATKRVI